MADVLSTADAARLLGVVPATVRHMEKQGQIPALRTEGGVRIFLRDDVERIAEERAARQKLKTDRAVTRNVGAAS